MENYRKKYEDALKRAEAMIEVAANREEVINCVSTIFPEEFKESDEGIRKEIIHYFKDIIAYSEERKKYDNWIAWLEKQGEQIDAIDNFDTEFEKQVSHLIASAINKEYEYNQGYVKWTANALLNYAKRELEKQGEQNLVDKAKSKFKVGDWIITKDKNVHKDYSVCKIVEIENNRYHLENGDYLDIDTLEKYDYHLWTIQDAKDGDVLQLGKVTAIFKKYIGDGNCKCYCSVYDGEFKIPNTDNSYGCHNAVPATKEQRYTLEKAMTYAGYTFDFEKKEIELLISNGGDFEPELTHKEVTEKSEKDNWSEEQLNASKDERIRKEIISLIVNESSLTFDAGGFTKEELIAYLEKQKKLSHQEVNKKSDKVGWSEEDEKIFSGIYGFYNAVEDITLSYKKEVEWLKSIKERLMQ